MKRIIILLVFTSLTLGGFAQTKSKSNAVSANSGQAASTTIFLQLIIDESINTQEVKIKLIVGTDNKFYVQDKRDIDLIEQASSDIISFRYMTDALNYLNDKGFVVENFSSVIYHENIRHTFIISKLSNLN